MASRLELQIELETLLDSKNVYYQPPESKKLEYDAIVYSRSSIDSKKADDKNYLNTNRYDVTFIYRDPDSEIPHAILNNFKYCSHNKHFASDNLYHDVFTIFY